MSPKNTVFENHRKSLIQHCEQSKLRLHFEWTKSSLKMPKMLNSASFWKPEAWVQTVILDRSILVGKNWWKIPKFKNANGTFWWFSNNVAMRRNWHVKLLTPLQPKLEIGAYTNYQRFSQKISRGCPPILRSYMKLKLYSVLYTLMHLLTNFRAFCIQIILSALEPYLISH